MIKDMLIILSIHPVKGWVRRRSIIGHALLGAIMYDLAIDGYLRIVAGRIEATVAETGDPVLDTMLEQLGKLDGKKFSLRTSRLALQQGRTYRRQMQHLESRHLISSRSVEWLGITWGKRYRVNRIDKYKPIITKFERCLVYGNEPGLTMRLIIDLLGMINLLKEFFPDKEFRIRAKKHYHELVKKAGSENSETLLAIRKEIKGLLQANKATGW